MSIHYKFRSSPDYDTLKIDGQNISLADLREAIMAQKKMSKTSAYTLEITDAQTKKVYTDDRTLIPKNSSVIVKRVPAAAHGGAASYMPLSDKGEAKKQISLEKLTKVGDLANANATEEDKIAAMMNQSGEEYALSAYMRRPAPPGSYTCYKCGQAGHFIRNCPTVTGTDAKFTPRPQWRSFAGIPKDHMSQLMKEEEKKRTAIMEQAGQPMGAYRPVVASDIIDHEQVPPELQCPICIKLFTDAVLIPCCGTSYCDECIRNLLIEKEFICPNCQSHTSPDQLVANVQLRKAAAKHRNQLEGVNKGVSVIRSVNEDSNQKATPDRKEESVDIDQTPAVSETDSTPKTEPKSEQGNSQEGSGSTVRPESTAGEGKKSEESVAHGDSKPVSQPEETSESKTAPSKLLIGSSSLPSAIPSALSLPKVSSHTYLAATIPYSSTPLVSGSLVSNPVYNSYMTASVFQPRLSLGVPRAPVLGQGLGPGLPIMPRNSTFHGISMLPNHAKPDLALARGMGLNLHGVGPLSGRPSTLDPMMALDSQQPLSEEEFYRTQKKLKSFSRRQGEREGSKNRYHSRRFDYDKRKNESSRRARDLADSRNRGRSRDRPRHSASPRGAKRRFGSGDAQPRTSLRHYRRSRSSERSRGQRSPKYYSRSHSRSRSRSVSRSRSKSFSRSRSNSFSRSPSRSPSRSSSLRRKSRSPSEGRSPSLGESRDASPQSEEGFSDLPRSRRGDMGSARSSERKWSTSPEDRRSHESSPDDAVSLSPTSQLGFSDGQQERSEEEDVPSSSRTEDRKRGNGKGKSRVVVQGDRKNKQVMSDGSQTRKDRRTDGRENSAKGRSSKDKDRDKSSGTVESSSKGKVTKQKSELTEKHHNAGNGESTWKRGTAKGKPDSVTTHKGEKKSSQDTKAKEKVKKGADGQVKSSRVSGKEDKTPVSSMKNRLESKSAKIFERKVTSALAMEEEEEGRGHGLQISKDKDGTVREVFTSRARKRGKEEEGKRGKGTTVGKEEKGKEEKEKVDSKDGKMRIVCMVEPEVKKKRKEVESDQRRVVLSTTSVGEPEVTSEDEKKSKRSGKRRSKNKKHKKHKHKKNKKKKHKLRKTKTSSAEEDSDADGKAKTRRRQTRAAAHSEEEGEEEEEDEPSDS